MGRAALVFQWMLSAVLTLALLAACQRIRPDDGWTKLIALLLCGGAAVYFRTFAMIRGEPYLATLAILLLVVSLGGPERGELGSRRAFAIALLCSAIVLSRQLGVLLLAGWAAFAALRVVQRVPGWGRALVLVGVTVPLSAGWFYLRLESREGTPLAWNLPRSSFSLANQPLEFYVGTGSGALFSQPGRPRFQKQLLPVLHADWWGDYWHYFLFAGKRSSGACVAWPTPRRANTMPTGREDFVGNYEPMLRYLGVVNALALLPLAVALAGLVHGARALLSVLIRSDATARTRGDALAFAMVASTIVGYLWFVISYPRPDDGDTVKATYVFQLAPLVALLAADATGALRAASPRAFRVLTVALLVVVVVASPTWISRWRGPLDCTLPRYDG